MVAIGFSLSSYERAAGGGMYVLAWGPALWGGYKALKSLRRPDGGPATAIDDKLTDDVVPQLPPKPIEPIVAKAGHAGGLQGAEADSESLLRIMVFAFSDEKRELPSVSTPEPPDA